MVVEKQRRLGELAMIGSGIGLTIIGHFLGILSVSAGGLAITGLGIFSVFWH
ncbi:MAG TPA: hypothetical protein VJR67_03000 [Candidatus Nitrosopolaris sp.]|jgi:hypothetical protein|nr:hypothetical protein [Candidatus Nitrosopolaris sp.]